MDFRLLLPLPLQRLQHILDLIVAMRPSDSFDRIPGTCKHRLAVLVTRLFRAAADARNADAVHSDFLRIHLLPTAVFRRLMQGEAG